MIKRRREAELTRHQRQLLLRSTELRLRFAGEVQVITPPLRLADRVHTGWRWLRAHPEVPLLAVAVVVVLRPRRALHWGLRLWAGWRTVRRLQRTVSALV